MSIETPDPTNLNSRTDAAASEVTPITTLSSDAHAAGNQPYTPQTTPPTNTNKNKRLIMIIIGLVVLLALVLAVMMALLTKKDTTDSNRQTTSNGSASKDTKAVKTPISKPVKNIVTVPSADSNISVTITGLNKSANTLTVNYQLNYAATDDSKTVYASAYEDGIYTTRYAGGTPEPYMIDDTTGQKFGLIKDDTGKALATDSLSKYIKNGESINGYVTLSLPPNHSTVGLSLGNMSLIPNLVVAY